METNNLTSRKSRPVQSSSTWSGRLCTRIHSFEYSIPASRLSLFRLTKDTIVVDHSLEVGVRVVPLQPIDHVSAI